MKCYLCRNPHLLEAGGYVLENYVCNKCEECFMKGKR